MDQRNIIFPREVVIREAGKSKIIEGWAILFGTLSAPIGDGVRIYREIMEPGSVTKELLDASDFRLTMFHDRQIILARSNMGRGTLNYNVTAAGVRFWAEMPDTEDGRRALELVARGDISGCSFTYTTNEADENYVTHERKTDPKTGEAYILRRVKRVTGIYDFTLAASPAYPQTTVSRRERGDQAGTSSKDEEVERVRKMARRELGQGTKSDRVNALRKLSGQAEKKEPRTKTERVNALRALAEREALAHLSPKSGAQRRREQVERLKALAGK